MQTKLTQQQLKELLVYEEDTGNFYYKSTGSGRNDIYFPAGGKSAEGYIVIEIGSVAYKAHRLVWLYVYGKHPTGDIDHINQVRSDNRLVNLREVSRSLNAHNTGHYRTNTSGVKGVCFDKKKRLYVAQLNFNNTIYKKRFKHLLDASDWIHQKRCELMPEGHFHV